MDDPSAINIGIDIIINIITSKKPVCCRYIWFSGMYARSVLWSTNTACLWLNVPRPTSWPLIRTLNPDTHHSSWSPFTDPNRTLGT